MNNKLTLKGFEKNKCKMCGEVTFLNSKNICNKCNSKDYCGCGRLKNKVSKHCKRCAIFINVKKRILGKKDGKQIKKNNKRI